MKRFGGTVPDAWLPEVPRPLLYEGIPDEDIRLMLSRAVVRDCPAQRWLYRQGEAATKLFLLQSGVVRLSQMTSSGDDVLVRLVAPGEIFGYFSLTAAHQQLVSAQALQPSRMTVWDKDAALQMLQHVPRAALNLFNLAVISILSFGPL
jgi:CRP-like cAMP-binding protein